MQSVFLRKRNLFLLAHISRMVVKRGGLFIMLFMDLVGCVGNCHGFRGNSGDFLRRRRGYFFGDRVMGG